jgi:C-terminal processing protease CtpA/Prc
MSFSESKRGKRMSALALAVSQSVLAYLFVPYATWAFADRKKMDFGQRNAAVESLKRIEHILKDRYYDASFHGMDLKARAAEAIDRVDRAETLSETYGIMAWMLEPLNDSHTFFLPPRRPYDVQNGWELGFVGEKCYITAVQPGSDAAVQGIKPGDEVISLEDYAVTRENLWKLQYAFGVLAPRAGMHLVLHSRDGKTRTLLVNAKVEKLARMWDPEGPEEYSRWTWYRRASESRIVETSDDLMIWKLPVFRFGDDIDKYIRQARTHQKLILDVRHDPGGAESTVSRLLADVFDKDIRVGERVERGGAKPWDIKSRGPKDVYSGKLVVLIDSESASAAEIFARVVQIEKRAVVVGDRSSGKVMEARHEFFSAGNYSPFTAGMSVTVADIHLADGKSLENVGVVPDVTVLPTAEDLSTGHDPVLARAAAELGVSLTSEQAGKLLPMVWREN